MAKLKKIMSAVLSSALLLSTFTLPVKAESEIAGWTMSVLGGADVWAELDYDTVKSGNSSLKIVNKTPKESNVYGRYITPVAVEKDKQYRVSLQAKSLRSTDVYILFDWGYRYSLTPLGGTYDWTNYEFLYTATKTGTQELGILVDGASKSLWIDDLLVIDPETGENIVQNSHFEGKNKTETDIFDAGLSDVQDKVNNSEYFTEDDFNKISASFENFQIREEKNLVIDGDKSDWESHTPMILPSSPGQYVRLMDTISVMDITAECKMAYDAENFYGMVEVTDDIHHYIGGGDFWKGDGAQIAFSGFEGIFGKEIGVVYNPETKKGEIYSGYIGDNDIARMDIACSQKENKTVYEFKIPWDTLFDKKPEKMLFNILVNDNDGEGRGYCFEIVPGICMEKNNAEFPTCEMVSGDSDWSVWIDSPREGIEKIEHEFDFYLLNRSDEEKTLAVENITDGSNEVITLPPHTASKRVIKKIYESYGSEKLEFKVSDGENDINYTFDVEILRTPVTEEMVNGFIEELHVYEKNVKELLDKCEKAGIPTDYEMIHYRIIERFDEYWLEDVAHGDYSRIYYNKETIDALYKETMENLQGYLDGTKEAKVVPHYITSDMTIDGQSTIATVEINGKEEERPVFFVGTGHVDSAKSDVLTFGEWGFNTTQMEVGPSYVMKAADPWTKFPYGSPSFSAARDKNEKAEGEYSLKITYDSEQKANRYYAIYQSVGVEAGKTYELKGKIKAEEAGNIWISANDWNDRFYMSGTYDWKDFSVKFTVPQGKGSTIIRLLVESPTKAFYLDDLSFTETESGNNILAGGDFEGFNAPELQDKYVFDDDCYHTERARQILEDAEDGNIAFDFLISPHYFFSALISKYNMAPEKVGFLKYNVNDPKAKELIEDYLRAFIPVIAEYDSLKSICITNEPSFFSNSIEAFYLEDWQNYLRELYANDISKLNEAYRSEFTDFTEVDMLSDIQNPAKLYDYKVYNDRIFAGWHKWMADIIKELAPGIPLHMKVMGYTASNRFHASLDMSNNGTGYMEYKDFLEINGCDYWNYYNDNVEPLVKEMWYDYMTSVKNAPVFNTEDHVIPDGDSDYAPEHADYVAQDIYQGAIHGRANSVMWVWGFDYDKSHVLNGSFMRRPDVISKVGKATYDLNRNAYQITALQNEEREMGIIYSNPDMLLNGTGMTAAYEVYEAAMFNGKRVKFITESNAPSMHDCKIVVVPYTSYITKDMLDTLKQYVENGGRVVILGNDRLSLDDHALSHDRNTVDYIINNSTVIPYEGDNSGVTNMTSEELCGKIRDILKEEKLYNISVRDAQTGEPVYMMEYNTAVYDGKLLINLANIGEEKNVKVYAGDKEISSSVELRSGEAMGSVVTVGKYQSITLEAKLDNVFVDTFGHWAEADITYLKQKGIVSGMSESRYVPEGTATRAEFLALLMRSAGFADAEYAGGFGDVRNDDWFANNVAVALREGIVDRADSFRPNEKITREEMCDMLVRCYEKAKGSISVSGDLSFTDNDKIVNKEIVSKAVSAGLMRGNDNGSFEPDDTATRAEVATVIKRYIG